MNELNIRSRQLQWFKDARMGLFIHWGLYALVGRGEWVMYRERIPKEEYARLAERFNPQAFHPEQWCIAAKKAGMKYVVLTSRHHEGFALFDSASDSYNSVKTASGRDFVAEYVAACRKHGLGVGIYFSLGDWRAGIMKESDSPEAARDMVSLTHRQIRELMTQYGKIDILWYDGGWCFPSTPGDTDEDVRKFWRADELNAMVRELQPGILINNRSGAPGDFTTPEGHVGAGDSRPWESCLTMSANENSGWGYWRNPIFRKSAVEIIHLLVLALSRGGNILFNVSPDENGKIPGWQDENLEALGNWVRDNAEAVYGVEKSAVTEDINRIQGNSVGLCAEKGNLLFFYMLEWPGRETILPIVRREVISATVLKTGAELSVRRDHLGRLVIGGLPANPIDPYCTVLKMEMGDYVPGFCPDR